MEPVVLTVVGDIVMTSGLSDFEWNDTIGGYVKKGARVLQDTKLNPLASQLQVIGDKVVDNLIARAEGKPPPHDDVEIDGQRDVAAELGP